MAIPINRVDFERFSRLSELIYGTDNNAEIQIYVSEGYVSLQLTGRNLNAQEVARIFELRKDGKCK